jgi:hypothetical protein
MPFPILGVLGAVGELLGKFIPDPQKAAEAKLKLAEMAMNGELKELEANLQIAMAQVQLNTAEANSPTTGGLAVLQKGWRPFIGWTCGAAFAYNFVLLPLMTFFAVVVFGYKGAMPPALDLATMLPVLLGMLGLGGMRSFERAKGKT